MHAHTHTHILILFEDCELTGLKVDVAELEVGGGGGLEKIFFSQLQHLTALSQKLIKVKATSQSSNTHTHTHKV